LLWLVATLFFALGIATKCDAQCAEGVVDRMVDVTHAEAEGFFVATADMECLLRRLEVVPAYERLVVDYRELMPRQERRYTALLRATTHGTAVIAAQGEAIGTLATEVESLSAELSAWWRSVTFWIGATAVALVGGLALGKLAL
jgi:hypothetical protein